jgi:probable addiction module antidote protein
MKRQLRKYEDVLDEELQDPVEAANYLNAAYVEGEDAFLVAMHDVARARGISQTAKKAGLQRVGLYKMLSKRGNPEHRSIRSLLDALDLQVEFHPKTHLQSHAA